MDKGSADRIVSELEALKKLAILQLLDKGRTQRQIALALGVDQATISRMFPKGALEKTRRSVEVKANDSH